MVSRCAHGLPEPVRQECGSLVESLPAPAGLVHGDCNPGNLVVCEGGGCVFVDADTVCLGDSLVDLAFARSSLVCEGEADCERQERFLGISSGQALELWEALFDGCCAGKGEAERAEAERFTEVFGWLALLDRLT